MEINKFYERSIPKFYKMKNKKISLEYFIKQLEYKKNEPKLWKPANTSLKETKNFTIQPMYVFIGLSQKVGQGLYSKGAGNEIYINCGIKWPRASSLCLRNNSHYMYKYISKQNSNCKTQ